MPAAKHRQGEAIAAYTAAILAEPGITSLALADRFGVTRASISAAMKPAIRAQQVERSKPGKNRPVQWFPFGARPSPHAELLQRIGAYLTACGSAGAALGEIAFAVSRGKTVTELKLQQLRREGKAESRRPPVEAFGAGTRPARWYAAGFALAEVAEPKSKPLPTAKSKALTLDPAAPPVMPAGVKVTRAPAPVERFAVSVPPGWVGEITRDWRERRLGGQR